MKANRSDYTRMKIKVFIQMLVMVIAAFVFVLTLYSFLRGKIGEWVVGIIAAVSGSTYDNAISIYTSVFRDNWYELIFFAIIVVFLLLFYFSLNWFGKYFDRINKGVDALVSKTDQDIVMPSEMKFMEEKLNSVRSTLARQRAEMELAEQKRADLIMYLAHDIRTPLTSVVGYLNLLDEQSDMPLEERKKYVHITLEKANRLGKLVDEFFEITRLNQNTVLNKISLDLSCMLIQLADMFYPQLHERKQSVKLAVEGNIYILGDSTYLTRAFQNILKNAIAYGDIGMDIHIGASCKDGTVTIAFTNTGPVISLEEQEHIFDNFFRADVARRTGTGGGAGLGLAIAQSIIAQHDGQISVKSENRTTTFSVVMPSVLYH